MKASELISRLQALRGDPEVKVVSANGAIDFGVLPIISVIDVQLYTLDAPVIVVRMP